MIIISTSFIVCMLAIYFVSSYINNNSYSWTTAKSRASERQRLEGLKGEIVAAHVKRGSKPPSFEFMFAEEIGELAARERTRH